MSSSNLSLLELKRVARVLVCCYFIIIIYHYYLFKILIAFNVTLFLFIVVLY